MRRRRRRRRRRRSVIGANGCNKDGLIDVTKNGEDDDVNGETTWNL